MSERQKVLDEVREAVRALRPKYMDPERPNPLLESGFAQCKEAVYAELRRLGAGPVTATEEPE